MRTIDFRPLRDEDLSLLHRWLNLGPVLAWYARAPKSLDEVRRKYRPMISGVEPTRVYISTLDGTDVGMLQTYRVSDHEVYARAIEAELGWAGMDYFTGEVAFRGRGLAARIVDRFVCEIVFAMRGIDACVSGPDPNNARSIRTLQRAGFEILRTVQGAPGETETLMIRRREENA